MDTSHALKIHVPIPAVEPRGAIAAAWAVAGLTRWLRRTAAAARMVSDAAVRSRGSWNE